MAYDCLRHFFLYNIFYLLLLGGVFSFFFWARPMCDGGWYTKLFFGLYTVRKKSKGVGEVKEQER